MHGPLAALRVAAAVALALVSVEARAAHRLTMERAGRQMTYVFDEDRVRIEEAGSPRVLIFDGKAMLYFEVDTERKTFAVATLKDVQAEGRAMESEIEAAAASLPTEERQRVLEERRERLARWTKLLNETRYEATKDRGLVAGHRCDGYVERVDGRVVAEGCYVPWSRWTIEKKDLTGVTRLAEFLNTGFASVPSAAGIDLRDGPFGRITGAPGVPAVRYDIAPDGKSGVQLRLVELVKISTPTSATFRPPASYLRLDQPPAVLVPMMERAREETTVQP